MANTNVFRGSDATLTLAPADPDVPEGAEANEVIEFYQLSPVGRATGVGTLIGQRAKAQGISSVVFDRGGYPFHGRVKAVADGARNSGLEF